jgi:hypothetical protein
VDHHEVSHPSGGWTCAGSTEHQARRQFLALTAFHLAAKDEEVLNLLLERTDQLLEMVVALGEHQRRPPVSDSLQDVVADQRGCVARLQRVPCTAPKLYALVERRTAIGQSNGRSAARNSGTLLRATSHSSSASITQ